MNAPAPAPVLPPDALRTIFTRPRPTVRWLVEQGSSGLARWLFLAQVAALEILALSRIGPWFAGRPAAPRPTPADAAFALLALLLAGIAAVAWCPAVALVTRLVGGRAPTRATMRALVWGQAPLAAALPVLAVAYVAERLAAAGGAPLVGPLYAVFGLWSLALAAVTIAEVNRLPVTRSALALLGALLLVEVALAVGTFVLPGLVLRAVGVAP